jgi:hypothetical protein
MYHLEPLSESDDVIICLHNLFYLLQKNVCSQGPERREIWISGSVDRIKWASYGQCYLSLPTNVNTIETIFTIYMGPIYIYSIYGNIIRLRPQSNATKESFINNPFPDVINRRSAPRWGRKLYLLPPPPSPPHPFAPGGRWLSTRPF